MRLVSTALRNAVPRLVALSERCSWTHYRAREWAFLIDSCDEAFVIEDPNVAATSPPLLGSILRVNFPGIDGAGATGLGMMLVDPATRGRGLGKVLMKEAMAASEGELIVLGVATALGQPMYEKMGYVTTGSVAMLSLDAGSARTAADSEPSVEVALFGGDHVPSHAREALAALDRMATGLDRSRALDVALALPGAQLACATDRASGKPRGAAIMVGGTNGAETIGPVVGDEVSAVPLIASLVASTDAPVGLKVSNHPQLVEQLERMQFKGPKLVEMTYEGRPLPGRRENYFALLHPTLG